MAATHTVFRNPALRLKMNVKSEGVKGRNKELTDKLCARLKRQTSVLAEHITRLITLFENYPAYDNRILIWAKMHDDALSVSQTPADLFRSAPGLLLRAPWRDGYLIEVTRHGLKALLKSVTSPSNDFQRFDTANIAAIRYFPEALFEDRNPRDSWHEAVVTQRRNTLFRFQSPSYSTEKAAADVLSTIAKIVGSTDARIVADTGLVPLAGPSDSGSGLPSDSAGDEQGSSTSDELSIISNPRPAENKQFTFLVDVPDSEALRAIILSGSAVRWEPVPKHSPIVPGLGEEPPLAREIDPEAPIVGVIDGGYHANRYRGAIAWEASKLVPDHAADRRHGNKVCSIIVDGHLWNNNLDLSDTSCRLGIVQAVPREEANFHLPIEAVAAALDKAMSDQPETMVWNLSANYDQSAAKFDVSQAGHLLGQIARKHDRLLVISAGNRLDGEAKTIAPPADCEAALVVAGRAPNLLHEPGEACPISRTAFGPDFMTKPDLSWYSEHRVLGGDKERATSYAAPLVSRLAAHCFQNIENPTADLVRALMINSADLSEYCEQRGFGTPSTGSHPWLCTDASIVLAWTQKFKAQKWNYWTAIAVPPSMIKNGRLVGRVKLVTILEPKVQRRGDQYLTTRFAGSLNAMGPDGWTQSSILAPIESKTQERTARKKYAKWQPVRCFEATFTEHNGPKIDPNKPFLRIGGRVYWRHKYMYQTEHIKSQEHEVSFALTLESADRRADTYNEFRQLMGENVAELAIAIDVEVGGET